MKNIVSLLLWLVTWSVMAQTFQIEQLRYTVTSESEKTVAVSGFESSKTDGDHVFIPVSSKNRVKANGDGYSVEVPETVEHDGTTYTVSAIGDNAFMDKYLMQSVSLPSTIVSIGNTAFSGCTALSEFVCLASAAPQVAANAFHRVDVDNCNLLVGYDKAEVYSAANVWQAFSSISQVEYLLTYVVDGETYKSEIIRVGTGIVPESDLTKEGYTFSGWSEIPTTMPAKDVEVTGYFEINTYKVVFLNEGELVYEKECAYGDSILIPTAPEKEGYTFQGWSPEVDATVPSHDVNYIATYSVNTYAVIYIVGEDTVRIESVKFGEEVPEYTYIPSDERFTFNEWIGEQYETMPAHDVVYVADMTDGIYTLKLSGSRNGVYDLKGNYLGDDSNLNKLPKGIYIVNGKKVMVK